MEDYRSNSHKSKDPKTTTDKKVEKVINGSAKTKKKSEIQKFADVFVSEDVSNVKSYILMDVIIPAAKKMISDVIVSGIDMILYGEVGHTKRSGNGSSKVSYRQFYDKAGKNDSSLIRARSAYDYDNILFETRGDAEAVLSELDELISVYNIASVMDLYSAAGLQCDYTYNKYGWTDIRSATVMRVNNGYVIKLPKALPLN